MKTFVFAVAVLLVAVQARKKYGDSRDIDLDEFFKEVEVEINNGDERSVVAAYHNKVFNVHKKAFGVQWETKEAEKNAAVWLHFNLEEKDDFNQRTNETWKQDENFFSSWRYDSQFLLRFHEHNHDKGELTKFVDTFEFERDGDETTPTELDWTKKLKSSKPEYQGDCKSSYAFAPVKAVEMHHQIKTGEKIRLSVQEVIDCSSEIFRKTKCDGGSVRLAFEYIMTNKGLANADKYSYQAREQNVCQAGQHDRFKVNMTKFYKGPSSDEETMKRVVSSVGPVVTRMDINHPSYMYYGHGVYQEAECRHKTNHAVLVVGYGTENGTDYWLIQDSMGSKWGENGLMKIARNKNNHCGIGLQYWIPKLE